MISEEIAIKKRSDQRKWQFFDFTKPKNPETKTQSSSFRETLDSFNKNSERTEREDEKI